MQLDDDHGAPQMPNLLQHSLSWRPPSDERGSMATRSAQTPQYCDGVSVLSLAQWRSLSGARTMTYLNARARFGPLDGAKLPAALQKAKKCWIQKNNWLYCVAWHARALRHGQSCYVPPTVGAKGAVVVVTIWRNSATHKELTRNITDRDSRATQSLCQGRLCRAPGCVHVVLQLCCNMLACVAYASVEPLVIRPRMVRVAT